MTLSVILFMTIANPGPAPAIPTNTTGIEQTAIWYKFTLDTELYTLLQNMDKSHKKNILGDVEDIYVRSLKYNYVG